MTRGWLAVAALAIFALVAAGVVLAPDPADADAPAHLSRAVEDGRASILDHLDLVEPGSRLVLTDIRCREDGGVLLLFTNRWVWLVERDYYASSEGPPGGPGDFGGGVVDGTSDPEIDAWLARADGVDCSTAGWQSGATDAYEIGYPAGWFVHPADAALGIGACTLFTAEPFNAVREADGGWAGASIALWHGGGCRGSFDVAVDERVTEIDGHRAFVHHLERGEGGPEPRAYSYFVHLSAPIPCEGSEWLESRTESDDPGGLEVNGPILDSMMGSVRFRD